MRGVGVVGGGGGVEVRCGGEEVRCGGEEARCSEMLADELSHNAVQDTVLAFKLLSFREQFTAGSKPEGDLLTLNRL